MPRSNMSNNQKSYKYIEHASTCPCATDEQDDCNCFYSALSKMDVFEAATVRGPVGAKGHLDDLAQAHIREFVARKRAQPGEPFSQVSCASGIYRPLANGEIRILELHPADYATPLRGNLHVASIDFTHPVRNEHHTEPFDDPANMSRITLTYTRFTNHAVSLATGKPVWYTALSYVCYELLSCVDHEYPLRPSWVPDWSTPRTTETLGYSTKAWTLYCAGCGLATGEQPDMILSNDKEITLSGKVVDSIIDLGCVSHDPVLDIDNPQARNRDLASDADVVRSAGRQTYPISGISVYDAFLQT
ncbi:hypothetical protein BDW02DRAFT_127772 [Decorospora gaudefroyi]|uniref:Uncharacterized protein n=1 Tax=Decorospora gaudefroyi TaxID=184978 RepID=A0A6A5JZQ8_9PLEO|nr:hypothetical protein BDW02DRAFT_127772 [Decorospora gaudefroyi]